MGKKIRVLVTQGLEYQNFFKDVTNFVKNVPNFVKNVPNFVKEVPRMLNFVPMWGMTSSHFLKVSK